MANSMAEGTTQPITTGSLNPPYQVYTEKEANGGQPTVTLHYQSITAMPAYRNMTFEVSRELWLGDVIWLTNK